MILFKIFGMAFIIGLSGAMMPGPVLTVTISESVKRGFWSGPLLILGHAMLELVLVLILILGAHHYLQHTAFLGTVGILGAGALGWMAYGMLAGLKHLSLSLKPTEEAGMHPIGAGILLSISNPYWTIWWVTIGLKLLVDALKTGGTGVGAFFIGHIAADLVWYSAVSLAVTWGRQLLTDRVYRGIIAACALALLGFGVYFAWSGAGMLLGFKTL